MAAVDQLSPLVGVKPACQAFGCAACHLVSAAQPPSFSPACGRAAVLGSGFDES
jgi:hypothetical protein